MLPHMSCTYYLIQAQAKKPEPEVHEVLQDVIIKVNFIKMVFK